MLPAFVSQVSTLRRIATVALCLAVAVSLSAQEAEGPRHALVIGNAAYEHFGVLANPANDARDMARTLRGLGFAVTELIDASFAQMDEAVFQFGETLAREGGVGLFYYAGHGVEAGGVNYLIPVEQRIRAERELAYKSIAVDRVLTEMEVARNGTNIIILDACRDNPLPANARSSGSSRGLSVVQAPSGSLVVYATSPGEAAADGRGRNGVFTGALLNHISTPGIDVMDMLRDVRRDVMAATGNEQTPWENSSLTTRFYFAGAPAGAAVAAPTARPVAPPAPVPQTDEVAQLYIQSDPMGAIVTINGEERGPTPAFIDAVPVGSVLEIEARDGSMIARRELQVDRADLYEVSLELEQATGNLVILTGERGLDVRLDGTYLRALETGVLRDIPAGERTLELSGDGLYYRTQVSIPIDGTARLSPELLEVGTVAYSLPEGATATVRGSAGELHTLEGSGRLRNVPVGTYRVTLEGVEVGGDARTVSLSRGAMVRIEPSGALRIDSTPPGAEVYIDGVLMGTTPVILRDLEPGGREVELRLEGYDSSTFSVSVAGGRLTVRESVLSAHVGTITYSLPSGSTATLTGPDGESRTVRGTGRLENQPVGDYRLTFTGLDVENEPRTVRLSRGATVSVGPANGALRVVSTPAGASVYVDGRYRGRTPLTVDSLEPGRRDVELRLDGYQNNTFTQFIVAGRLSERDATLEEISYSLDTVPVEGGTFRMGSASGGDDDERPVHTVTVDGFLMSETEVTFDQYDAFARATGRDLPDDEGWGRGDRPVINVSWYDAVAYANWLSEQDGLSPAYRISGTNVTWNRSANGWRLPTEAEWEYAARGGSSGRDTTYAGSDSIGTVAWYRDNSGSRTQPVGEKRANELGLYDMSGNVWEWCWDWYDGDYYEDSPASNPIGPASGSYRVGRGGSWGSSASDARVANRLSYGPSFRRIGLGFRLVLPAP